MIGYYVHHHGRGHLNRALRLERALGEPVTMLSSLPAPRGRTGEWIELAPDDAGHGDAGPAGLDPAGLDPVAGGRLHWVPLGDPGLSRRMHQVSAWLEAARPRLVVVDVSVEIALLVRLHGIPVASMVLPGRRTDPAHLLGFDIATTLIGMWPPEATPAMLPGLPGALHERVLAVGALSRFPVADANPGLAAPRRPGPPRALFLGGAGGTDVSADELAAAARSAPGWEWDVLGPLGRWDADPAQLIRDADVVVTHAGQNAVAEVAALRRPAIVIPQDRPHDEQVVAAQVLADGPWPVRVLDRFPLDGWADLLYDAAALDGRAWSTWCDGGAADRLARVIADAEPAADPTAPSVLAPTVYAAPPSLRRWGGVAVVTVVHGRHEHLRAQRESLARSSRQPDIHVVVAMDDPDLEHLTGPGLHVLHIDADPQGLPLAAARNLGMDFAADLGCEVLIGLDVDCLAGPDLVKAYAAAVEAEPTRLWAGPVTYLAPPGPTGYPLDRLECLDDPHPARPAPAPGEVVHRGDPALFWSLSYAVSRDGWSRSGGFDEAYVGYGAEDTDFGRRAAAAGLELCWVGSARAYHQHHPVSDPPVEHLDDILRNGRLFRDRWGTWPMGGWLTAFERRGLIRPHGDDYCRVS